MKSKKKNGGFTLVELLATLAILSLVVSIVTYSAVGIVNNAKQKSYETTVNNIKVAAGNYVIEQIDSSFKWHELNAPENCLSGENCQYQCVSIEKLIETGYFSADILKSYKSEGDNGKVQPSDMVYIERDPNTKNITHKAFNYNDILCNNPPVEVKDQNAPTVDLESSNDISQIQHLTITMNDDVKLSKYYFGTNNPEDISVEQYEDVMTSIVNVDIPRADTYYVRVIDAAGNASDTKSITYYQTSFETTNGTPSIDYIITVESKNVDLSKVKVTPKTNMSCPSSWKNSNGSVVQTTYVPQKNDTLFKECYKSYDSTTVYVISYNANGGTGTMTSDTVLKGGSHTVRANGFKNEGYNFTGWKDSSGTPYKVGDVIKNITSRKVLYAQWEEIKVETPSCTNTCDSGYLLISGKCCPNTHATLSGNYCVQNGSTLSGGTCSRKMNLSPNYKWGKIPDTSYDPMCAGLGGSYKFDTFPEGTNERVDNANCSSSILDYIFNKCYYYTYMNCKSTTISDCTIGAKEPICK